MSSVASLLGGILQVTDEKYSAQFAVDAGGPVVRFQGTVSTPNPSAVLNPFLDSVHERVTRDHAAVVTVDFRNFDFCNSSGFKSFIHWIERIRQLPGDDQYRLQFVCAPGKRWQRTSLLALTCFAVDTVEIKA